LGIGLCQGFLWGLSFRETERKGSLGFLGEG